MELPNLSEVSKRRKKYGLTQTELARSAGVSQSLIARIEGGSVDPRYSKVFAIFRALEEIPETVVYSEKIMTNDVVGVQTTMNLGDATKKMNNFGVSQMPVYEGDVIVGSISEEVILDQIGKGVDGKTLSTTSVKDIMEEAFPTVNSETPLSVCSALLEHNTAVIVSEKGSVKGIITKSDILKVVHE
ncbi:MAG: CBS domain-containing protein [Methanobacteriota archaeon]